MNINQTKFPGVLVFELKSFISLTQEQQVKQEAKSSAKVSLSQGLEYLEDQQKLFAHFKDSIFPSELRFDKKAYLNTQILDYNLENQYSDISISFTYESNKGTFKGILTRANVEELYSKTIEEIVKENQNASDDKHLIETIQEYDLELKDGSDVPIYKIKFTASFILSTIEQSYVPGDVSSSVIDNYVIHFSDVRFDCRKNLKTVLTNEISTSEIIVVLQVGEQKFEIDIENPKGTDKKNPNNYFFIYKNSPTMKVTVEERKYRLERDEQAFLQSIKNINTKHSTSIQQFLMAKTGGYGNGEEGVPDFNSIVNKKKILVETIQKGLREFNIEEEVLKPGTVIGCIKHEIQLDIMDGLRLEGEIDLNQNLFLDMPRGALDIDIIDYTNFKIPSMQNTQVFYNDCKDLVIRLSKIDDEEGDLITYYFKENQFLKPQSRQKIQFDTYYYDDYVKVEVFQKNSMAKANLVGKGYLELKEFGYEDNSIMPCMIFNRKNNQKLVSGIIYFKLQYQPRRFDLFHERFYTDIMNVRDINKYTYFDDYLNHAFKTQSQFGFISVNLNKLNIPKEAISQPGVQDPNQQVSQLLMMRIKIVNDQVNEFNQIFFGMPDKILNENNRRFFAKTTSINDRISIELYHVLNQNALNQDFGNVQDFKSMRLLSHEWLQIKNLPFDSSNSAENYFLLMGLENSGSVASFDFNFDYQTSIPPESIAKPINPNTGGLLFVKMVQSENQSIHHHKDLDKYIFILDVIKDGKILDPKAEVKQQVFSKRLFFNKASIPVGFVDIKIGDQVTFVFNVVKANSEEKSIIEKFQYEVTSEGLKGISGIAQTEPYIELRSWQPVEKPFILNYTHEGYSTNRNANAFVNKLTQENVDKQRVAQTQLQNAVEPFRTITGKFGSYRQTGFAQTQATFKKGSKTMTQKEQIDIQAAKYLIEKVFIEFELRHSDLSDLNADDQMEAAVVSLEFERQNIIDILVAKDLSENAKFEISNVSADKRCLKETKSFYISEIFENSISMRLFSINDTLQVKIADITEYFASLRIAQLPLDNNSALIYFFQIGTKQMKLKLELSIKLELLPPEKRNKGAQQNQPKLLQGLFGGLANKIEEQKESQKEAEEFAKRIQSLKGKQLADQIRLLKQYVQDQDLENRQLITKQNRLKREFERTEKRLNEANLAKPRPAAPIVSSKDQYGIGDINKYLSGLVVSQPNTQGQQQQQVKLCGCGSTEPKFRGYCTECVKKLKTHFDRYMEKFKKISEEYETYTGQDQKKADEKLRLMKNKIEQYEIKLSEREMIDVISKHEQLTNTEESKNFIDLKIQLQSMKLEVEIIKVKQDIELQDLKKQQDFMEMQVAKKWGNKRDLEFEVQELTDEVDKVRIQKEDIEKRMLLKKRYVMEKNKGTLNKTNENQNNSNNQTD